MARTNHGTARLLFSSQSQARVLPACLPVLAQQPAPGLRLPPLSSIAPSRPLPAPLSPLPL